jgi:hypothetical protein
MSTTEIISSASPAARCMSTTEIISLASPAARSGLVQRSDDLHGACEIGRAIQSPTLRAAGVIVAVL